MTDENKKALIEMGDNFSLALIVLFIIIGMMVHDWAVAGYPALHLFCR